MALAKHHEEIMEKWEENNRSRWDNLTLCLCNTASCKHDAQYQYTSRIQRNSGAVYWENKH